jgi:hypothetical protein
VQESLEGEVHLKDLKVYVSGYGKNPYGIERMRYQDDAPYPEIVKRLPHVAFEVDDLRAAIKGRKIVIRPNSPSPGVEVAFIEVDGIPVELLQIDHSIADSGSVETNMTRTSSRSQASGVTGNSPARADVGRQAASGTRIRARVSVGGRASPRLTEPGMPPTPKQIESWLGRKAYAFWQQLAKRIADCYPGVFVPKWIYGGKKHGWSLRYKKSKSFCTMIPEKGRCLLMIVFDAEERVRVEVVRQQLSPRVQKAYDEATTYHDGKWLLLEIGTKAIFDDVETLLTVKRKPKVARD